jgi:hypothetical protein
MGAQVGIFGNKQECFGVAPTFSGLTLLNSGRNLKTGWNFDDFITAPPDSAEENGIWTSYYLGAGAVAAGWAGTTLRPGQVSLETGTTNAGLASLLSNYVFANSAFAFGAGAYTFETDVYIPDLSTAAEEYIIKIGWSDVILAAAVDGVYFTYDRTANVNWLCVTANNSARTITDSGVAVAAGAWIRFKIVINALGTVADFYINDVLVVTNIANIPTGNARITSLMMAIQKTVGATTRRLVADWTWLHYDLSVSR